MINNRFGKAALALCATTALSNGALADAPSVVTDIAAIHSLVAKVMEGVGEPNLLVSAGQTPHSFTMRPSDAQALQDANLVIWIGEELTPWLEKPLESLSSDAQTLTLLDVEGTQTLEFREETVFAENDDHHDDHDDHGHEDHADHEDEHDHDDHADHKDEHDHDDHAEHKDEHDHDDHADHKDEHDHDHEEHADHDDHKDEDGHEDHAGHDDHDDHEDHAGHDDHDHHHHDGVDPHAWLMPANAQTWLGVIAETLATMDPDHADQYRENAAEAVEEFTETVAEVKETLGDMAGTAVITMHDAYQYFEGEFGLRVVGSISPGDATDPSPARIAELRDAVQDQAITCAFSEPQFDQRLISAVAEDIGVKVAVLDPHGANLEPGPDLYTGVLKQMATAIAGCK